MLIGDPLVRGAMLVLPTTSSGERKLIPQNELRRLEGSGMLIDDPLSEGSNASSTDNELWRAENSFLRMSSDAQKGAACS